jgi:putative hydrolase of the HAD superfamily
MVRKRKDFKKEVFNHIHPDIVPMFERLKKSGMKIGLISNCYSEEAEVIRQSVLYPFFDAPLLSYEQGVCKPDKEIFLRCVEQLDVKAEECLYVGDGGSRELEVAGELGMHPLQAVWYLKEGTIQPSGRIEEFPHAENPMDVPGYLE